MICMKVVFSLLSKLEMDEVSSRKVKRIITNIQVFVSESLIFDVFKGKGDIIRTPPLPVYILFNG